MIRTTISGKQIIEIDYDEAIVQNAETPDDFIPCVYCKGHGFVPGIAKVDFLNPLNSPLTIVPCIDCNGTGKMK